SWVDSCNKSHHKCKTARPGLPKRVLDVGTPTGGGVIRLCRSESAPSNDKRYVALSHCWGATPLPKTLTSNVEERREGIEFSHLPRSFQDAVTVTRSIGIRYLWIDSLCIIQDDQTDWQVELSRMADIYNNANLVIAASQAVDSTVGFI
ncbi:heterokaryon incompatibility protein-domain-containing protein, partial [Immersiella caudata]